MRYRRRTVSAYSIQYIGIKSGIIAHWILGDEHHIWDIDVLVLVWNHTSGTGGFFEAHIWDSVLVLFFEHNMWDVLVLVLVWNITSGTVF